MCTFPIFFPWRDCSVCAESCSVELDKRHPDRMKKYTGILCQTAGWGENKNDDKRNGFK